VLVPIRNCEIGALLARIPRDRTARRALGLSRSIIHGLSFMDAEARRRQLAAAIRRVAGGDRAALRLVYDETAAKLFGVCLRILNDRSEAEDVLQEVYLTVWRKASAFDETRASPITWLVAIARNRAIDRVRSGNVARLSEPIEAADTIRDPAPLAAEALEVMQENQRLYSCLEELEQRQSAAIRSAFMDGLTYDELAQRSGVPLGTMKSWIRRGLAKLRACLER
jgi:RNA polymerase sigma factor (sigma-70 family)